MRLVLLVLLVFATSAPGAPALDDTVDGFTSELERILELERSITSFPEAEADGLASRVDGLGVALLRRVNAAAAEALGADTVDDTTRAAWLPLLDRCADLVRARNEVLTLRGAEERAKREKFERSAQADIARAFEEDLRNVRRDYADTFVDQIELRREAGLPVDEMLAESRGAVGLALQQLSGQVRLDAMSLDELRARLVDSPFDGELKTAFDLVHAKQERNLQSLERLIDVAERVDIDVSEQRSQLISERGALGVEILDREVFTQLLHDQVTALKTRLWTDGPDVVFRGALLALILFVTWVVARATRRLVSSLSQRKSFGISRLARAAVVSVVVSVVWVVGIVAGLATIGVALGPLFAGVGVFGIVVGFAVQDSLANLASGVMILVFRPFDVDDHIKVAGAEGLVKRMNFLATTIHTFDNKVLIVPNGRIWGDTIENLSASQVRRVDIDVSFAYDEDPDRVHDVLLDVITNHETVLKTPAPAVHFTQMGDSALVMKVKPWVRTTDYWTTYWDLHRAIVKRFAEEGIEIPFPQRVVHMVSGESAPEAPASAREAPPPPTPPSAREDDEPSDGE